MKEKYGPENVLQWNIHYDETTPHLHVLFAPIVRDAHNGNRYSSANFLGGPGGSGKSRQKYLNRSEKSMVLKEALRVLKKSTMIKADGRAN